MVKNINYQKRKNQELFKELDFNQFSSTQNYIPIYKNFFSLNDTNYNAINLNHTWHLTNVQCKTNGNNKTEEVNVNKNDNKQVYNCLIKNVETNKSKKQQVFFKLAPLLDPYKYLTGKYNINDNKLFHLPDLNTNETTCHKKILDVNNSAYVDSFFFYLNSQLIYNHHFIHGVDFFGSFLSIKNNFAFNIYDDLEYLNKSDFFNKNKNILFDVDNYSFFFNDEENDEANSDKKKCVPIQINNTGSVRSNISIHSFDDNIFENIFHNDDQTNEIMNEVTSEKTITLENLKNMSLDLEDILNKTEFFENNLTTTIKSGSTCSSRSSYTENNDNCCSNVMNNDELNVMNNDDENSSYESIDEQDNSTELSEEYVEARILKFPVQIICMECCENTFDDLILNNELSEHEWLSAFIQIIMILISYQKMFAFTHNDLHTNNVMYNQTDKKYIYYCYKKKYYKVPTFGRIFKMIDFGRSIYKYNGQLFCSDSFQQGGDAATQYNTEPYYDDKKPRLEPNYSFDLCRLACSIFDYVVDDLDSIKDLKKCNSVVRMIVEWCLDDKGVNLLYKADGSDRYPDFKLYKMIARYVHNHTPQAQLERNEFKCFIVSKNKVPDKERVINIDELPVYI